MEIRVPPEPLRLKKVGMDLFLNQCFSYLFRLDEYKVKHTLLCFYALFFTTAT